MTQVPVQTTPLDAVVDLRLDLPALLDTAQAVPPDESADAFLDRLAAQVGAFETSILLPDISGRRLARLPRGAGRPAPACREVRVVGSQAGAALLSQRTQVDGDDDWVCVPISHRGEALGVLEMRLALPPGPAVLAHLAAAARGLAYVLVADRRFSDVYERTQRSSTLSLEAEIQRRLLPASYACEGPGFALAGWLVPADEAGGDTFDYAVDRDVLHLSITDAMGHGLPSAQLATLAVGSLRNSRRRGLDLTLQAQRASAHVATHAAPDQFVTALLGRLDLRTGAVQLVNAGHMNPLLVRDGRVRELPLDPGLVLGVVPDEPYEVQRVQLQPGDRLALVTDGMSERDAAEAEIEDLLAVLGHLHPRQAVHVLTDAVLHVTGGAVRDDATVLVVDWHGPVARAG